MTRLIEVIIVVCAITVFASNIVVTESNVVIAVYATAERGETIAQFRYADIWKGA